MDAVEGRCWEARGFVVVEKRNFETGLRWLGGERGAVASGEGMKGGEGGDGG